MKKVLAILLILSSSALYGVCGCQRPKPQPAPQPQPVQDQKIKQTPDQIKNQKTTPEVLKK